jgi:TatD DNase family protein
VRLKYYFKGLKRMSKYIDTHAHIYSEYYDDIPWLVKLITDMGVEKVINAGCDTKSNKEVLDLSKEYDALYCAIGIHPENVDDYTKEDLDYVEKHLNDHKVVAIGEIGLDYHYTKENKEKQIELFEYQLALAEKYHLPVVVHSRDATEDTINSLKKYKVTGVIHSFSGSLETANIYIKMGFALGINGVITFKNSKLKEVIAKIPLEKLVLETDSPYLSPEPKRGKTNDSTSVLIIAEFLANLYEFTPEIIGEKTTENALRIFDKLS